MVSSYAPMKCGIGAYALQMVKKIQNQGNSVKILSPPEGGGDFRTNLKGGFNLLKLIRFGFSFDKIIIHDLSSQEKWIYWSKVFALKT